MSHRKFYLQFWKQTGETVNSKNKNNNKKKKHKMIGYFQIRLTVGLIA